MLADNEFDNATKNPIYKAATFLLASNQLNVAEFLKRVQGCNVLVMNFWSSFCGHSGRQFEVLYKINLFREVSTCIEIKHKENLTIRKVNLRY